MLGYTISIAALLTTIWYEKKLDKPSMEEALDELEEDEGFDFGKHYWVGQKNTSALAIDKTREKICLLRAYKGWQQIDFDELVEYDTEEKEVSPPGGGFFAFLKALFNRQGVYKNITLEILISNMDCYKFKLDLITTDSKTKLAKARKQAKEISTLLRIAKLNGEKKQNNKPLKIVKRRSQEPEVRQATFNFS